MGMEIERKFLVKDDSWRTAGNILSTKGIEQWYLNTDPRCTVRVRTIPTMTEFNVLCIKGKTVGFSRPEIEKVLSLEETQQLRAMREQGTHVVCKMRSVLLIGNMVWEVDKFYGDNEGLVVAEVELQSEDQQIILPPWVGEEVTTDHRYSNSMLAKRPFIFWDKNKYETPLA